MDASLGKKTKRFIKFVATPMLLLTPFLGYFVAKPFYYLLIFFLPVTFIGWHDMTQKKRAILKNFPILGHGRYLMEMLRPEMHQYFIESNTSGMPFDRLTRSNMYQRAKQQRDTLPFGAQKNMYEEGYEWVAHSMAPIILDQEAPRINIGGDKCTQPYSASLYNISAMSFGSLSPNAVIALSKGAQKGKFAHNTGEGGVSPYHIEGGGDLIWQIGTGYFGCRSEDGTFNPDLYKEQASLENIKMIELKISQGAKPGHGGILPGGKVTPEIARIRKIPVGKDANSPPNHSAFNTPLELLAFITQLRELSGGKPVGFKLCLGKKSEFVAICKAMVETGIYPDYISVDGGEGGTGAAPLEFSNSIGHPLEEGLVFVHQTLTGFGLRDKLKIMCAGKITTGFDMMSRIALGADLCYSARGFMFALGCIQALTCNSNECPTGVATQNKHLYNGLNVANKADRVYHFHEETLESFMEILGAAGYSHPSEIDPNHLYRRVSHTEVLSYKELFGTVEPGELLALKVPKKYEQLVVSTSAQKF